MNIAYLNSPENSFFSSAQEQLDLMIKYLDSSSIEGCDHGKIEQYINEEGHELLRRLFQGHLDSKAESEERYSHVLSPQGKSLNHIRCNTKRKMTSLFGTVVVTRLQYSQRNEQTQSPLDTELNLAADRYSDGVRYRLVKESIRGSFDEAIETINTTTGAYVPKRQSLDMTQDVATDFDAFYQQNQFKQPENTQDLLVLSFDGKGIVMRPDSLRACTQKAAQKSKKLNSRLSAGEKKDRKRMAQVAAVYTSLPHVRTAEAIMNISDGEDSALQFRTPPRNKRVWASVERDAEQVIEEAFLEALSRDPDQKRKWVILVDGHPHQLKQIHNVMNRLQLHATVVMDFIHVLEYLWKAAWCFFDKGDDAVEEWIEKRALKILNGQCSQVAKGMRISASKRILAKREGVDKCATYLLKNKQRLQYDEALAAGFPIASGVIEGACRHLINDRLDITGARWSLAGAEAILKLRSLKSSGDLDAYWVYHKEQSKQRLYGHLMAEAQPI